MAKFYVNKNAQDNGDHEVHKDGCEFMPDEANGHYLGDFLHCALAVEKARQLYPQSNGCFFCCRECHTA